jgi:hypothetical protein
MDSLSALRVAPTPLQLRDPWVQGLLSLQMGAAALAARAWRGATLSRLAQATPTLWPRRWMLAGACTGLALVGAVDGPLWWPAGRSPGRDSRFTLEDLTRHLYWHGEGLWVLMWLVGAAGLALAAWLVFEDVRRRTATGSAWAAWLGHHAHGPMVVLDAALQAGLSVADGLEAAVQAAQDPLVRTALVEVQAWWREDRPLGGALWDTGLFPQTQRERLLALRRADQLAPQLAALAESLRQPRVAWVTRPTGFGAAWLIGTALVFIYLAGFLPAF